MKNYQVAIGIIISTLVFTSCVSLEYSLIIDRLQNGNGLLKLDGYYYDRYETSGQNRIDIYFLYENGVILYGSSPSESELSKTEESYRDGTYYERVKDLQYHWGVYKIEDDNIYLNMWSPSDWPYQTFLKKGKILDDQSFKLETAEWSSGKGVEKINERYKFEPLSPKPDSTNTFIK